MTLFNLRDQWLRMAVVDVSLMKALRQGQFNRKIFFLALLLTCSPLAEARHIVGGELRIRPLNSDNLYEITLLQFWDGNNLSVPTGTFPGNRDNEAWLYIYSKRNRKLVDSVITKYKSSTEVVYQNLTCAKARALKTMMGTYRGTITLEAWKYSDSEGYFIAWERCCRNNDIDNILEPGATGMAFYLEFPPVTTVDSSPEFQFPNGLYICINRPFTMNMSAKDADGDELRYRLVAPMRGNSTVDLPIGVSLANPVFPIVSWRPGLSLANAIPGSKPLTIDQASGIISVTADAVGLYVFAIECAEFRNGRQIGLVRRDFQLLVIDCADDKPVPPVILYKGQESRELTMCSGQSLELETAASDLWSYQWQRDGFNIAKATSEKLVINTPGTYTIAKSYKAKCTRDTISEAVIVRSGGPTAMISAAKTQLCPGDSVLLVANDGEQQNPSYNYLWQKEGSVMAENSTSLKVGDAGIYILKVQDVTLGCVIEDTLAIGMENVDVTLPDELTILRGKSVLVTAVVSPPGNYTYQWLPADQGLAGSAIGSVADLKPDTTTTYTVTVTSENGCSDETNVKVHVVFKNLYVPTAFSPNSDGHNEGLEIFVQGDQIRDIRIFNRWGQIVFQSEGYKTPWDGRYKGDLVPAGMYPYIIRTTSGVVRGELLVLK